MSLSSTDEKYLQLPMKKLGACRAFDRELPRLGVNFRPRAVGVESKTPKLNLCHTKDKSQTKSSRYLK